MKTPIELRKEAMWEFTKSLSEIAAGFAESIKAEEAAAYTDQELGVVLGQTVGCILLNALRVGRYAYVDGHFERFARSFQSEFSKMTSLLKGNPKP